MIRMLDFQLSGRLIFGRGALSELPSALARLNVGRVLIVTDPGLVRAGICASVTDVLAGAGITYAIFDGVEPDPRMAVVDGCLEAARDSSCEALIGLGGGSALDIAKITSALLTNTDDVAQFIGVDQIPNPTLPKVLIPTTSGTGSEVSPIAILSDEDAHLKKGVVSPRLYADVALVDSDLTLGLPPHITAYTGVDALTHAIEAYTNKYAHPLVDGFALHAIELISNNLRRAVACGDDPEARFSMAMASTLGGFCLGTVNTGAVHALAYPLGGEFDVPHGVANSLLLPYIMRYNLISNLDRFAHIARVMGYQTEGLSQREAAEQAVEAVVQLCRDIGIVSRMRDLDVPESAIEPMAVAAMDVTRLLSINPRTVTLDAARAIYRQAY